MKNFLEKQKLKINGAGTTSPGSWSWIDPLSNPTASSSTSVASTSFKSFSPILLLLGLNEAYIKSQSSWWNSNNTFLTLDAVEYLIKNFLIKQDFAGILYFASNQGTFYSDKNTLFAFENSLSKLENGKLLSTNSVYALKSTSIVNSPYIDNSLVNSSNKNYGAFTSTVKSNYDANYIYLYNKSLTAVNPSTEFVIDYKLYSNNVLSSKNLLTSSVSFNGIQNATQQITAGTRLPTILSIKVETGYENTNTSYVGANDYYCYKYDIFGLSNSQAMIDLGRKCYNFIHSEYSHASSYENPSIIIDKFSTTARFWLFKTNKSYSYFDTCSYNYNQVHNSSSSATDTSDYCLIVPEVTYANKYNEFNDLNLRNLAFTVDSSCNISISSPVFTCRTFVFTCKAGSNILDLVIGQLKLNNFINNDFYFLNKTQTPYCETSASSSSTSYWTEDKSGARRKDYVRHYTTCTTSSSAQYYEAVLTNQKLDPIYATSDSDIIKLPPPKFDSKGLPIRRYVKVTKLSHETTSSLIAKSINLNKVTEIIPQKFTYPFSAMVATKIDSRSFSQVPNRTFDCKLKKVLVPSNYFPCDENGQDFRYLSSGVNKFIYDGDWDGSFKLSWTNNPAWILMDILINKRYGLGNYIESNQIDIWELYKISRWCDCVDDLGRYKGVPDSYGGVEPRYTFNVLLQEKFNIFDMLNQIASSFRGNIYYMNSLITFDCDRLKPAIGEFNNSDVKDGIFSYTNHKKDEEFSAVDVAYVDSKDFFKPKIEYVEDSEGIRQRGLLKKQLNLFGVTSRGQAIRAGKHFLFQTSKENSNVSFTTDLKALLYKPGDLISINDELYNNIKNFGVVKKVQDLNESEFTVVIDKVLDSNIYNTGEINLYIPTSKPKYDDYYSKIQSFPSKNEVQFNLLNVLAPLGDVNSPDGDIINFGGNSYYYPYKLLSNNNSTYAYTNSRITMDVDINSNSSYKSYTGKISFLYNKITQPYFGLGDYTWWSQSPIVQYSCDMNFTFSYFQNEDLYSNYSQQGVWKMFFENCQDYITFDSLKNADVKNRNPHYNYFWEFFDSGKYSYVSGVNSFGENLYGNYFFDTNANASFSTSDKNTTDFFNYKKLNCSTAILKHQGLPNYTKFNILEYSKSTIAYSELIQSDKPSIETFYIKSFENKSNIENNKLINEYSILTLHKLGKDLNGNFSNFKSSLFQNGVNSFYEGSSFSLKLTNKNQRLFKIMSIAENYINEYNILATEYNLNKFNEIEENSGIDDLNSTFNFLNAYNSTSKINTSESIPAPIISLLEKETYADGDYLSFEWAPIQANAIATMINYHIYIQTPSKQTDNFVANYSYSNLDPSLNKFIYRMKLGSSYELGTYTVSVQAFVPEVKNVPNTIDSMYKFSTQSRRSITLINY